MTEHVIHISSREQLLAHADAWDDLWQRSKVTSPTLRAEAIALWHETLAPQSEIRALVIKDGSDWVAALPLVSKRLGGMVDAACFPTDAWCACGDLLLDESAPVESVMNSLIAELPLSDRPLCWLDAVRVDEARWQRLMDSARQQRVPTYFQTCFEIGRIEIQPTWDEFQQRLSRSFRKSLRKSENRLAHDGSVRLRKVSDISMSEAAKQLECAFDIETRSWKARAGTSIRQTANVYSFYLRFAELLARWRYLDLAFLELDDRPIAFEFGWTAKRVYHSFKVGYDEQYRACGPGQMLLHHLLKTFHQDEQRIAVDCMGPVDSAIQRWRPDTYRLGRLILASRGLTGRFLLQTYKHCWPGLRRLKSAAGLI